MRNIIKLTLSMLVLFCITTSASEKGEQKNMNNIHNIEVKNNNMEAVKLSEYKGKVLLIVNVASECGYTKQYSGLQELYEKYNDKGFEVVAFPCNDFGGQEPGTNEEIEKFCTGTFGVTFPLMDKVKVLGDDKCELYKVLTHNTNTEQGDIKWNFEKFLISKDGEILKRYRSAVKPMSEELTKDVETALKD